jgi:hypothetical protein
MEDIFNKKLCVCVKKNNNNEIKQKEKGKIDKISLLYL